MQRQTEASQPFTIQRYTTGWGHSRCLDNGADVNTRTTRMGNTPLHYAASKGHMEVLRPLLAKAADNGQTEVATHSAVPAIPESS